MAIHVGTKAPDFTLRNSETKEVSLKDFAGKTLIIHFFPAAFTGVCTEQLCSNRDDLSFYNDLGATVVAVSVDLPFSLAEFKKQQNINFDLLSDFNKTMIKAYGFYLEEFVFGYHGVSKRGVVVVDKNGNIAYSQETEGPGVQVDFPALKTALETIN